MHTHVSSFCFKIDSLYLKEKNQTKLKKNNRFDVVSMGMLLLPLLLLYIHERWKGGGGQHGFIFLVFGLGADDSYF